MSSGQLRHMEHTSNIRVLKADTLERIIDVQMTVKRGNALVLSLKL